MSPDPYSENFTSSVPFPCETATSGTSQGSGATPWGYPISHSFLLFPPQIGHRDIHGSTRASEDPSPGRPCLWEGLSYLLFVLS